MSELEIYQSREDARRETRVQPAHKGRGPLYQRDYLAVFEGSKLGPEEIMEKLRREFPDFAPPLLANFAFRSPDKLPLDLGDEMEVVIRGTGCHKVRVVCLDPRMLTLRTIEGHPEAGRVTFAAYYEDSGRLTFRIRTRARMRTLLGLVGYWVFGMKAQAAIWSRFIKNVGKAVGAKLPDGVYVRTQHVEDTPADLGQEEAPTFPAR